jgi:hypothetical protein
MAITLEAPIDRVTADLPMTGYQLVCRFGRPHRDATRGNGDA